MTKLKKRIRAIHSNSVRQSQRLRTIEMTIAWLSGQTFRQIGGNFSISRNTVGAHVKRGMRWASNHISAKEAARFAANFVDIVDKKSGEIKYDVG